MSEPELDLALAYFNSFLLKENKTEEVCQGSEEVCHKTNEDKIA
jgi:hypothetical protein